MILLGVSYGAIHMVLQAKISKRPPIKAVKVSGSAVVSGGYDDTIEIHDLFSSAKIGSLHQSTTITSLSFFTSSSLPFFPSNLLASDADDCLSIYHVDPFVHLKTLKVRKKGVNYIPLAKYCWQ